MKVCTIILARGGSKGIPKKNIMSVCGKPLIQYSIEASMAGPSEETFVSTDSHDIASVSRNLGCHIINRPEELATDESSSEDALIHFALQYHAVKYDTVIFIQPTSPLIESKDLYGAAEMLEYGGYDSVFSVYREHWTPRWSLSGKPLDWDINNRPRRQDCEDVFVENGAFYITRRLAMLENKLRYNGNIGMYEMPASRSFQIDVDDDVKIIERLINEQH